MGIYVVRTSNLGTSSVQLAGFSASNPLSRADGGWLQGRESIRRGYTYPKAPDPVETVVLGIPIWQMTSAAS
jgi:hypothetical protein